jgi:hypothetical protein
MLYFFVQLKIPAKLKIIQQILCIFILVCSFSANAQNSQVLYSFFVSGHAYGQPGIKNGLYPPFKKKFDYIRNRPEIKFGVFTGDIVAANPTADDWDKVDIDIKNLGLPVYFAVGNHDMEDRELFESRYGETYFSFAFQNDLFIVLDPNIDGWNISGEQMDFLKKTLLDNSENTDNIFVFFHQLLWWKNNSIYTRYRPNSFEGKADKINFWSEVEPMFSKLSNEVFMFAGDVGAGSWAADFMYDKYGNISLIASGMGEGDGDNFVVANVHEDKSVSYDLICLNDTDLHCFGDLTDYRLTTGTSQHLDNEKKILICPNPASRKFQIRVNSQEEKFVQLHLFDLMGRKVLTQKILANSLTEIKFESGNGLYLYWVEQNGQKISTGKLLFNNS